MAYYLYDLHQSGDGLVLTDTGYLNLPVGITIIIVIAAIQFVTPQQRHQCQYFTASQGGL